MIKRRFFRVEHADGNDASDTSSSSSDSDSEVQEGTEAEEEDVTQARQHKESPSSPSGYESEDSSAKEVENESSDESQSGEEEHDVKINNSSNKSSSLFVKAISDTVGEKDSKQFEEAYILKSKSVFKCRLCPRIVCLTEETLNTHLKSKRHTRSTKLLNEGRLKTMLNSDGEAEEDGETHAERLARTAAAAAEKLAGPNKKNRGRQRQRNRLKKKKGNDSAVGKAKSSRDIPPKKRLKESKK